VVALVGGYVLARVLDRYRGVSARRDADTITQAGQKDAERILKEAELAAKEELYKKRESLERETNERRNEMKDQERRLAKREDNLERKLDVIVKKEKVLDTSERKLTEKTAAIDADQKKLQEVLQQQTEQLHRVSGISRDDAQRILLERLDKELTHEAGALIIRHEDQLRESCEQKACEIISTAIQRWAAEHTTSTTVSTVDIPSDDMKGRIIGREGRNIRAFEKATGVDVIVDDTPGIVVVSGFDNVRRETAKRALQKLIQDGRIHPSRIEEVVQQTQGEMDKHIADTGKQAALNANVQGLHGKETQLLGRLKFRTSYGQNVLQHSLEVAYLAGMMAEELGLDGPLARRCGLLHDIGKAVDHEVEGGHPKIGADIARRYHEPREVVQAIADHHDNGRFSSPYVVLVSAADAISASRPGARRETLEKYVKRLEELEDLANGFAGVDQAYAIQAGREVRVMVDAGKVDDSSSAKLCRDIAKSIEDQLTYPGEVKVTVLRETRVVEFAR